ncbi:MAG: putative sugar nucleotidyl transferase [Ginsengibacter sp.]
MNVLLDDLPYNNSLYPFTALRSIAHVRVGILTIYEKWQEVFPGKVMLSSEMSDRHIEESEFKNVPANIIPSIHFLKKVVASKDASVTDDCKTLQYPWDIFIHNDWAIREDFELITVGRDSEEIGLGNKIVSFENIFVEPGASINFSILNAEEGPIYIGKNARIEEGCMIRGPFSIGEEARLKMGTKVYGATTIGPYCMGGGEIKNSVMMGYSNKGHDGYLGDSVIGEWCNLGAGTSNSNLKNTAGTVKAWSMKDNCYINAGTKCGLLMGDYSRCAINTSFNTGTVVGISCNIFGNSFPSKYIQDFTWGNEKYIFEKAVTDINNWKKLKGFAITEKEIESLKFFYELKQQQ